MAENQTPGAASGDPTKTEQNASTKPADEGKQSKKGGSKSDAETPSPTQAELDALKQRLARGGRYKNRAQTAG